MIAVSDWCSYLVYKRIVLGYALIRVGILEVVNNSYLLSNKFVTASSSCVIVMITTLAVLDIEEQWLESN